MFFFEERGIWAAFAEIQEILERVQGHESDFLSQESLAYWQTIRAEKYRRQWLAGRICATNLWFQHQNEIPLPHSQREVTIVSRNPNGKGMKPTLFFRNISIDRELSISHLDEAVLTVLAKQSGHRMGCDLILPGSISVATSRTFFHDDEIVLNEPDKIWAVKETAYKALNNGEAFAPRRWNVSGSQNDPNIFLCSNGEKNAEVKTFLHNGYIVAVFIPKTVLS
jgi:hypothetical protein